MQRLAETYRIWALLISGLMAGAIVWIWNAEDRQEDTHQQQLLVAESDALISAVSDRFDQFQAAARSIRWYAESAGHSNREGYRDFLSALHLSARSLGAQGLGVMAYVVKPQLDAHERQQRASGRSDYRVKPAMDRDFYAPIALMEPEVGSNIDAIGFDVASNPKAFGALLASRDSSEYLLSERLTLVQDTGREPMPAFVLYAPFFRQGVGVGTEQERRSAIRGWVSIPFRVQDFFGEVLRTLPEGMQFSVYQTGHEQEGGLLFSTPGLKDTKAAHWTIQQRRQITLGGQSWTLAIHRPNIDEGWLDLQSHDEVALLGLLASGLIGTLMWRLGASRVRAKEETRQALANLSRTFDDYRGLLEAIPDLMFELDSEGRYHQYRGPGQDLLYTAPSAFLGKTVAEVLPPEVAQTCMAAIKEASVQGTASGHEIVLEIAGETHWFELSTAVKDNPVDKRFVMLSRDITSRKKAQLKLQQSEERLRLAVRGGNIGLWEWTCATGALAVNDEWCRMLGLAPEGVQINMDLWTALVHPEDFKRLEKVVSEVLLAPDGRDYSVEIRARHQNGQYVWILDKGAVLERDVNGLPVRILGSHLDITAQKEALDSLRVSAHALMASTQGIVITDPKGVVISVNPAFCFISGYSETEMLGNNCKTLQGPETDPGQVQRIRSAIDSGTGFSGDILNYRKDGSAFWNDLLITPVRDGDTLTHFIGVSRDITDKKLAERQLETDRLALLESRTQLRNLSRRLQEAQENERRRVAHELHDELGQTLTALKINLQTTGRLREGNSDKVLSENVRIVDEAISQVRHLALALRPSMLDDLGLPAALRWLASTASVNRDVAVNFDYQTDQQRLGPEVETACFRIVQEALTNVRRHAKAHQVQVSLQVAQGRLKLSIQDDGQGFDASGLAQRVATHPSLGILGMRERAASIGGTIDFESLPGQGCRVVLQCELTERSVES